MPRTLRAFMVIVFTAALVPVTAAQAGPVREAPLYCGPGYHQEGARCIPNGWKSK